MEVADLEDGGPTEPGCLGTVVITPYHPYRECMPVIRYDTRDVVRALPDGALDCSLAGTPATSAIEGKAGGLLRVAGRTVTPRDLVEVLEALPSEPWPARFAAVASGREVLLTVPRSALDGLTVREVEARFAERDIPVRLDVVADAQAAELRALRADLIETTFWRRSA